MRPPPATASRTARGMVRVTLEHMRGSPHDDITPEQARMLAAELLVAASEDASRAAGQVADGIEIAQTGHQLFSHIQKVAKKNGWVR